jgi:hypothetical protein
MSSKPFDLPLDPLLQGPLVMLPLAPLTNAATSQLPEVVGRIGQRLRSETEFDKADKLWAATFVLFGLRYPPAVATQLFRGVIAMEESSTYQLILSEGVAKGERKILLRMGTVKFGVPDAKTLGLLDRIADLAVLEMLGERMLIVSSWQELLADVVI